MDDVRQDEHRGLCTGNPCIGDGCYLPRTRNALPRAVAEARITCLSCPWQAEGRLWDGPYFYFRIRHHNASLGFGTNPDKAIDDSIDSGRWITDDRIPWCPTDQEAWALFDELLIMDLS